MCQGIQTTMSCGHTIFTHSINCDSVHCQQQQQPQLQPVFLNDSCSACHRPASYAQNRARHEAEHAVLMGEYMRADAAGDEDGMRRARRAMLEHTLLLRQRNFVVSLVREKAGGDVEWPGLPSRE
ncbi:hypothetical protein CPAR01_04817 [Colletotrichum paranaense]|uniref:Uncharacterized protein n=1 Tax=Colletotrichum paranaense TaxID=1914294 RepID=A0ABQ9SXI3_9PEZI|nr:uncharacterized protein CPAR01_04817 [Colletotrichum paranaense]KAK1544184.1 hypothetical protein CPAR01_04817 [Colletotrichum paranaense]